MEPSDLRPEDGEAILQWAITASAAVVLMQHHPEHDNSREAFEMLNHFKATIESMYNDIPDALLDNAYVLAENTIDNVNREEDMIDDFVKELDEFKGVDENGQPT